MVLFFFGIIIAQGLFKAGLGKHIVVNRLIHLEPGLGERKLRIIEVRKRGTANLIALEGYVKCLLRALQGVFCSIVRFHGRVHGGDALADGYPCLALCVDSLVLQLLSLYPGLLDGVVALATCEDGDAQGNAEV